jgi:hypothetical protein
VNVIVPVASPPRRPASGRRIDPSVLPNGPFEPGLWAVPDSVAVSVTGCPNSTAPVPCVVSVGFTGLTVKHSVLALSLAGSTPGVVDVKSPRQQYRPAEVTVAAGEITVPFVVTDVDPTLTPPVSHRVVESAANGPQRWNETEPWNDETPVTSTVARSVTWIAASLGSVGIVNGPVSAVPLPSAGVVEIVDTHPPKPPRTKSFSVAVVDVEDRVSEATFAKHSLPSPSADRLTPPS